MGVGRRDQCVLLRVGIAIQIGQPAQHFLIHVLHGQRQFGDNQQQPRVPVLGIVPEHKRP
ncbi:Uncharacterised protein [Mycobacterium tuberculosis]|nr:Uncharacterised protein [Mycobacterium tuberculosis]